ncbi:MAG: 5,5-dehydrodivanillate O-demethylase oxygenase subunit [Chloroflexota bacterium]|jgi:5,5'-dehydrodivanillate O-demethylase|nr:5,5-dehydrodivanillate O-demethylase oxygenase subunit [Chloroflexota bacterium]
MVAINETAIGEENGRPARVSFQDFLKTGPGTLAGRYLRSFWQPVYRSQDLASGRALPLRIMSEDLALYRGESGDAHLVAFRCAHRGTQLSTGWVEGDNLRCFYHGWVYDGNGQCVEQPAEPEPFCERIKIRAYPVREYLGFVFAYLGDGEAPEFPRLAEFEHPEYVHEVSVLIWPGNYFTQLDNSMDQCHTAINHWHFGRGVPKLSAEETAYGMMSIPEGPGYEGPSHFVMPNAHEWGAPPRPGGQDLWSYARGWRVPIDDQHYYRFGINVLPLTGDAAKEYAERQAARAAKVTRPASEIAEDVLAGRLDPHELKPELYPDLVNIQDYVAQVGQGDIASQPHAEHLGRSDVGIILLRKIWAQELQALAEGKPQRQWVRPPTLWNNYSAAGRDTSAVSV